ncbi:MAG: DUF1289 domain-containing protein [bacterium]
MKEVPLISPCTKICSIDITTNLCAGCMRTIDEITNWVNYTDQKREKIMDEIEFRKSCYSKYFEDGKYSKKDSTD